MDFQTGKISNRLIVSGLIWGLAFRLMGDGMAGVLPFLIHISIPVILFILLFQIRAIGAGDIKLFSVAGGFLSIRQLLYLLLTAFVVAAGIGVFKLLYQLKTVGYQMGSRTLIHFSTAILIAYFIVVWGWGIA